MTPEQGAALHRYWHHHFPRLANTVITRLGTCNGVFAMEQREFAPQYKTVPWRNSVLRTANDVLKLLHKPGFDFCTMHFGAIFAAHHGGGGGGGGGAVEKPRDFERHHTFLSPLSSPMGEFILDVDLDHQYDRSRICECGTEKRVCNECWSVFMIPAQYILTRLLREMLGFKAVFCVFSGRRGFHIWSLDWRAVTATRAQRTAWLAALTTAWRHQRWIIDYLRPLYDQRRRAHGNRNMIEALYPKLDERVTTDAAHMHKAPLVPHPETGNLCLVMGDADDEELRFCPDLDTINVLVCNAPGSVAEQDLLTRLFWSECVILDELKKLA